ncbi:1035_t:CDS:2 [Paraglomus brasilianum]|uniref:1035_t:CDS:1 n=1 Tax=Paraglomus brasilianum TaxID=144538 RepID=A0A9N9D829_9GLOM|nr:1035_t:CDS:2 [Paraglomus brasilianum]
MGNVWVKDHHVRQAVLELMSAIYLQYPVAIILTDLGKHWQFFWLQQSKVITCIFSLKQAKTVIEQIVREASQIATGEGALETRTIMKKPNTKVDLMQLLPEGDVAQMQDVFDVMTSEEVLNVF